MTKWLPVVIGLVLLSGCGPAAYKITPIPVDEKLEETVVRSDRGFLPPRIALIDLEGIIVNLRDSSLFGSGENPTALMVEKLHKAAEDPSVKAVVLRINSPGGGVTASDILYREVLKVRTGDPVRRTTGKPVVVAMMDVCASGGYYIACAANEIHAEPTSVTGSIGVVMLTFNIKGLFDKIGVSTDAIKSGPHKDAGSPFRPLPPEERRIFQNMIDEYYSRFVGVVAEARPKLGKEKVRSIADGRIYTGDQACALGLIDHTDGLEGALARAKELAGIKSARVVMYHRPIGYRGNIYSSLPSPPATRNETNLININIPDLLPHSGAFLYLWQP